MHDLVTTALAVVSPETTPPATGGPDTAGLADWVRNLLGPLLLVIISVVAIFFLFTREITRFVQFILLAVVVLVIFYFPDIIVSIANGVANALGIKGG
ncbi:hypothetical protein ACFXJ8_39230 [Nonomuraea sp. NPDC059194]|uniref:hypothetical protein n=1 Tax=Nonomuraea sp. NPDC059194 TaxID=3346764 RepID=UPI0036940F82